MTSYIQQMESVKAAIKAHEDLEKRYNIDLSFTLDGLRSAYDTIAAVRLSEQSSLPLIDQMDKITRPKEVLEPKEKVS